MNNFRIILSMCLFFGIAFAQDTTVTKPCQTRQCLMNTPPVAVPISVESVEPIKTVEPVPTQVNPFEIHELVKPVEPVEAKKFAVYVSGAEAGINKSLGNKLIADVMQSDKYSGILEADAFYEEVSKNDKVNVSQIIQIAKKHKAEVVFLVNLTEAFGQHSVSASLIENGDIVKTVSLDHALKSMEDLNNLSREIVSKLIQLEIAVASAALASSATVPAPVVEQCDTKYNINEVLYNVREGFLSGFKDCASDLVKETVLAKSPLAKKPAPEPKSFMKQCVMDNINKKLEGVPSGDKITNTVQNFLETLLKAALSGGDPKALVKAASNLDISGMMETISSLGSNSSCFVNEPYEPPAVVKNENEKGANVKEGKSIGAIAPVVLGICMIIAIIASFVGGI